MTVVVSEVPQRVKNKFADHRGIFVVVQTLALCSKLGPTHTPLDYEWMCCPATLSLAELTITKMEVFWCQSFCEVCGCTVQSCF